MRRPLPLILATLAILVAWLIPVSAQAAAPTMSARFFYGAVTINGQDAPVGTVIEARGSNVRTGLAGNPLTTTQPGSYGVAGATGSKLIVQNDPDIGDISLGTAISFYVNGFPADSGYTWPLDSFEPHVSQLNLSATIQITTAVALTSSLNPCNAGQAVTLTAVVSSQTPYVANPSGSFDFFDGLTKLGSVALTGNQAVYTTSFLVAGTHIIKAAYTGDNYYLTSQNTLTQIVNSNGNGGGNSTYIPAASTAPPPTSTTAPTASQTPANTTLPGVFDLTQLLDSHGKFLQDFEAFSSDGGARINIPAGTIGASAGGSPLTQISIQPAANPGNAAGAAANTNFQVAGLAYDLEPSGAQFSQSVTLTLTYDPAQIPAGQAPFVAWWNAADGLWEKLETVNVDPVKHTITALTTHFTVFSSLVNKPASTSVPATMTTQAPATTTPVITPTTVISNPATPVQGSGNSHNGLIIGLGIVVVILIAVIVIILRRKPQKGGTR